MYICRALSILIEEQYYFSNFIRMVTNVEMFIFIRFLYFKMNIFIAGLSYNLSEAELEELFAEYGEVVSAKVIMDRETGRSKGYGFVEMAEDEAGNKAIEALNGAEVDGKTLSVSVARPKTEGPRRSYNNNGGGGYHGGNRGGGYGNRDNNYGGGNRDNNYGGGRNRY